MGKVDVARIGCRTEIPARYSWRPRRKGKHARHELASIVEAMSLLMGTSLGRMRFSLDGEVSGTWTWFNLTPGIALACQLLSLSRPFCRFIRVLADLFPNNPFCGFVEIGVQGLLQGQVFRPKRPLYKRPRRTHHDGRVTLALIAIRF